MVETQWRKEELHVWGEKWMGWQDSLSFTEECEESEVNVTEEKWNFFFSMGLSQWCLRLHLIVFLICIKLKWLNHKSLTACQVKYWVKKGTLLFLLSYNHNMGHISGNYNQIWLLPWPVCGKTNILPLWPFVSLQLKLSLTPSVPVAPAFSHNLCSNLCQLLNNRLPQHCEPIKY